MDRETMMAELERMRMELVTKQKLLDHHTRQKKAFEKLKRPRTSTRSCAKTKISSEISTKIQNCKDVASFPLKFPLTPSHILELFQSDFDSDETVARLVSESHLVRDSDAIIPVQIENSEKNLRKTPTDPVVVDNKFVQKIYVIDDKVQKSRHFHERINESHADKFKSPHLHMEPTSTVLSTEQHTRLHSVAVSDEAKVESNLVLSERYWFEDSSLTSSLTSWTNVSTDCSSALPVESENSHEKLESKDAEMSRKQSVQPSPILSLKRTNRLSLRKKPRLSMSRKFDQVELNPNSDTSLVPLRTVEGATGALDIFLPSKVVPSTDSVCFKETVNDSSCPSFSLKSGNRRVSLSLSKSKPQSSLYTTPSSDGIKHVTSSKSELNNFENASKSPTSSNVSFEKPSEPSYVSNTSDVAAKPALPISESVEDAIMTSCVPSQIIISPVLTGKSRSKRLLGNKETIKMNLSKKLALCTHVELQDSLSNVDAIKSTTSVTSENSSKPVNRTNKNSRFERNIVKVQNEVTNPEYSNTGPDTNLILNVSCPSQNKVVDGSVEVVPSVKAVCDSFHSEPVDSSAIPDTIENKENIKESTDLTDRYFVQNRHDVLFPIDGNGTDKLDSSLNCGITTCLSPLVESLCLDTLHESPSVESEVAGKPRLEFDPSRGPVSNISFNGVFLTVFQEKAISYWQTATSSTRESWREVTSVPRRVFECGSFVARDFPDSTTSDGHGEPRVTCVELWEASRDHTTTLTAVVYTFSSGQKQVECHVVDLGCLEKDPNDETLFVVVGDSSLVVGATCASATIKRHTLALRLNDIRSSRVFAPVETGLASLHQVTGLSSIVAGSNREKVFLWLMEDGRLLRWFPLCPLEGDRVSQRRPLAKLWWCREEKGYLFVLLQARDCELILSVINLTTGRSDTLRTYDLPTGSKVVRSVSCTARKLVALFSNGYVVWNVANASRHATELTGSLFLTEGLAIRVENHYGRVVDVCTT